MDREGGLDVLLGPAAGTLCAGAGDASPITPVSPDPVALDASLTGDVAVLFAAWLRGDVGVTLGTRAAAGFKIIGGSMPTKAWVITQFDHPGWRLYICAGGEMTGR